MVFPQALGKSGLKPAFSRKSKVAVPKLKFWNSLNFQSFFMGSLLFVRLSAGLRLPPSRVAIDGRSALTRQPGVFHKETADFSGLSEENALCNGKIFLIGSLSITPYPIF
jgi:hypothetical protein